MASFFNLTLDTLAPAGLSIILNDGAQYATSANVTANHNGYITATNFLFTNQMNICCFYHCISGFDCTNQASGFYHT